MTLYWPNLENHNDNHKDSPDVMCDNCKGRGRVKVSISYCYSIENLKICSWLDYYRLPAFIECKYCSGCGYTA